MSSAEETEPALQQEFVDIRSVLTRITKVLSDAGIDEPRANAELLVASVLEEKRGRLAGWMNRTIDPGSLLLLRDRVDRRLRREPLQYILGETEFMGLSFLVDPGVLIPRPETELLVERALAIIRSPGKGSSRVLDLGTGSGNIAVSLATFAPGITVTALEASPQALNTARANVARHHVPNVALFQADLFQISFSPKSFDIVVANPPYIPLAEFDSLQPEVRQYEPRIATTDESDGLRHLRRILELSEHILVPAGALLVELGYGQASDAVQLARGHFLENIVVHDDLSGIPRVLEGWTRGGPR